MTRLHIRSGVNPEEPDVPVVTLVVDPDGPPGERAVHELFSYCYEGDGVVYLVMTDGWAEHTLDGNRLVVEIAVYPGALGQVGVDAGTFPGRSALDPEAALVLRAETVVDPELYARAAPATAVFTAGPDRALDDLLAADAWPMVLGHSPADETDE
ncbi:hypothetical protein OG322_38660 [Streptomyces sp. NBC_01260]|uniref:hypothetical protein n=1 Tax=unclassified Streptomyces TaxID=2593676 RepID=UPI000F46AF83|nr:MULTISPECIES: hypothetical protein [unclassified Streptomyces]ROQ78089.1 hypothetical protein EDD95_4663 [Streptomyces sp. CEV 2-1]RPK38198.1 hypothetical protein EES39_29600 [Streptomyces sp. ADI92-24]